MAEFVAESEKQGLELLTDAQKEKLNKIRIAKAGMVGVLDAEVADALKLDQQQKEEIAEAIGEFKTRRRPQRRPEADPRAISATERSQRMLKEEQKKTWEALSGVPAVAAAAASRRQRRTGGSCASRRAAAAQGSSVQRAAGGRRKWSSVPDGKMKIKFQVPAVEGSDRVLRAAGRVFAGI